MKKTITALYVIICLLCTQLCAQEQQTFANPILSGFYPDPSICRVGEDYYMVNSSFEWFPALPIHHSYDLVNWELIGYGIDDPEKSELKEGLKSSGGIFAPTIRHHDGLYYIIVTNVFGNNTFYITATDPRGEWSTPKIIEGAEGIDPSLFWDDDGRCYLTATAKLRDTPQWQFQKSIWGQEFDPVEGKLIGERVELTTGHASNAIWAEGPHIYKVDGKYILLISEGGTEYGHGITQFHSNSVLGKYTPHQINPILTHRHLGKDSHIAATGHADIVETQNGEWWMVALATRYFDGYNYLARETFLVPMVFEETIGELGIIVNPSKGQILSEERLPNLTPHPFASENPRDNFNGTTLAPLWNMLRTPHETWWSINNGELTLDTRKATASDLSNPSLLAQRITDIEFTATTALRFNPKDKNEEAGIILYRNDKNYIVLSKTKDKIQGYYLIDGTRIEAGEIKAPKGNTTILEMHSDGKDVTLYVGEKKLPIATSIPLNVIATRNGGEFNGTMIGLYTTSNGIESSLKAKFEYFTLE